MLDVVLFKWTPTKGYRSKYDASHVNIMRNMIARNYRAPHRVTCVTDDPTGIDADVRIIPLWDDYASLPSPHGGLNPSCYRRLKLWSEWARDAIGERILSIDLDMLLVADVRPLWNRTEEVILWKDQLNKTTPYNGAMQLFTAGCRPQVWDGFHPVLSPQRAREQGYFGSDQAWLASALGPNEARWGKEDGAYSWNVHIKPRPHYPLPDGCIPSLPPDARIVNFHGSEDPWSVAARVPWVAEHYR